MKGLSISIIASIVLATSTLMAADKGVKNLAKTVLSKQIKNSKVDKTKFINSFLKINQSNTQSDQIIVKIRPGTDINTHISSLSKKLNQNIVKVKQFALRKPGIKINNSDQIVVIKIKDKSKLQETIKYLRSLPGVIDAREDKIIHVEMIPNDTYYQNQWDMEKINAPTAWNAAQGDNENNIIVGVIDTGVDYLHPDLQNNIWVNEAEANGIPGEDDDGDGYVDDIHGIDVYNGDSDPMDDNSHGTHVSGTIGAVGDNAEGVAGINWHTKIAACKFLGSDGSGYTSGAIECVNYFNTLKQLGYNIVAVNNSWGGGGYDEDLYDALSTANDLGIIHVCAAGNDGADNDSDPHYPSSYDLPNIIAVAATDEDDELADFSNYGATSVDLAAPGVNILSTLPSIEICQPNEEIYKFTFEDENSLDNWDLYSIDTSSDDDTDVPEYHWGRENPGYESDWSISDSPDGNYPDSSIQNIASPTLDLSNIQLNEGECVGLQYNIKGEDEYYWDYLEVYISNDGGDNWTRTDYFTGNIDDWITAGQYILPEEYLTSEFRVGFSKNNDDSINYDGYKLDNITVYKGTPVRKGYYGSYDGTSMATPHVTGAIALAASIYKDENITERVNRILQGVDALDSLEGKVATGGRLNLVKVLNNNDYANVGIKNVAVNSKWETLSWNDLEYNLSDDNLPVIIAGPLSFNGPDGATVRIKDINSNGFSIRIKEWNYLDGNHKDENVSLLVLNPGRYLMPDGNVIEIGTFELSGTGKFKTVEFQQKFESTPYLFLTVNTFNGPDTVVVRAKDVNTIGFKAALFEEEDLMESGHVPETVAYMAIYAPDGNGTIPLSDDVQLPYTVKQVQIASKWDTAISPYEFLAQEEQSLDEERAHVYENIDILLINDSEIFGQDVSTIGKDPITVRYRKAE